MTIEDLEAFVRLFDASDWTRVEIELKDFELVLSKTSQPPHRPSTHENLPAHRETSSSTPRDQPARAETAPVPPLAPAAVPEGCVPIRAPHMGTFYRAPKPGAPPYVELGQTVAPDTEVCLLEVMKLFTTLRAGVSGTVRGISAKDSELIESGEVMFWVEPSS